MRYLWNMLNEEFTIEGAVSAFPVSYTHLQECRCDLQSLSFHVQYQYVSDLLR